MATLIAIKIVPSSIIDAKSKPLKIHLKLYKKNQRHGHLGNLIIMNLNIVAPLKFTIKIDAKSEL